MLRGESSFKLRVSSSARVMRTGCGSCSGGWGSIMGVYSGGGGGGSGVRKMRIDRALPANPNLIIQVQLKKH